MNRRIAFRSLLLFFLTAVCVLVSVFPAASAEGYAKYTRREMSIFDTEISFIGFAPSEEAFETAYAPVVEMLEKFDQTICSIHISHLLNYYQSSVIMS